MKQKKKRNKKYKPKQMNTVKFADATAEQQIQYLWGNKKPYCKVCDTDCTLASDKEVQQYKQFVDVNYQLKFVWVPDCNCWEQEPEWMADNPR